MAFFIYLSRGNDIKLANFKIRPLCHIEHMSFTHLKKSKNSECDLKVTRDRRELRENKYIQNR